MSALAFRSLSTALGSPPRGELPAKRGEGRIETSTRVAKRAGPAGDPTNLASPPCGEVGPAREAGVPGWGVALAHTESQLSVYPGPGAYVSWPFALPESLTQ